MTDNEIIKGLECCVTQRGCSGCSYTMNINCQYRLIKDAFDLIKRQQAEIEKLKSSRDRWKQLAKDFDESSREDEKEIESLYAEIADLKNQLTFRILERRV